MPHLLRTTALAGAAALLAGLAPAADMTFTPASGSGVVIYSAPSAPALQVQPDGKVQLPGLPGTPATATTAVCHDAAGTLQRCDPAALAGPAGPIGLQGPPGPQGIPGLQGLPGTDGAPGADGGNGNNGSDGADGKNALLALTTEAAGANCANGGQKVEVGVDANDNGTLEAGEIDDTQTAYICHGAKGEQGDPGSTGPKGTDGINGLPGNPGAPGTPGASAVLTMEAAPIGNCPNGGQRVTYGVGATTQTTFVCNGLNGAPGSNGGLSGVVHGCFTDDTPRGTNPLNIVSGATLYTVGKSVIASVPTYTIGFSPPFADTAYTVLLDGRSATGRALALKATKTVASLVVPQGWLDEGLEANDPLNICFMLTH